MCHSVNTNKENDMKIIHQETISKQKAELSIIAALSTLMIESSNLIEMAYTAKALHTFKTVCEG